MTLVAFDFDGTLADAEMTVRLGAEQGVEDEMAELTRAAMNDEVAYAESLRERVRLLEGLSVERVRAAYSAMGLRDGAADLLRDLRAAGHTTAILTGGFRQGVEQVLEAAGVTVDRLVANELPVVDGALTGEVTGPLVEGRKDDALADICATDGFALQDVVAAGDGANDRPMLEVAGLAVGFDPKPAVEPVCDVVVADVPALRTVLEAQGLLED
jgi:phosphoserine phosphatase